MPQNPARAAGPSVNSVADSASSPTFDAAQAQADSARLGVHGPILNSTLLVQSAISGPGEVLRTRAQM